MRDATHVGWFWFVPVLVRQSATEFEVAPRFGLPDFLLDLVAFLDATTGRICEALNPSFEWNGFAFRVKEIR